MTIRKGTNDLSKRALAVREVIANAKDPEKTFFEDFPTALGYTIQVQVAKQTRFSGNFIKKLQESIKKYVQAMKD